MTIGLIKAGGWATNDTLGNNELNSLQTALTRALDRTSAGDNLSGPVTLSGAGRIIPSVALGPNFSTTITVGANNTVYQLTSAITADCVYTLSTTGAATGDIVSIFCDASFTRVVTVRSSTSPSTDIYKLGNVNAADGAWATFINIGGWRLYQHAIGSRMKREEFLANGTWTCPAGVTSILIYAYGGGGAGGDGNSPNYWGVGASGGGGAQPGWASLAVTPGTTYTVNIGAGGNVSSGSRDGQNTWFGSSSTVWWPGGLAGAHGFSISFSSGGLDSTLLGRVPTPGMPWGISAQLGNNLSGKLVVANLSYDSTYLMHPQVGGFGGYPTAGGSQPTAFAPTAGRPYSDNGFAAYGGSAGANSTYCGGGGGGGAGPGGAAGTGGAGATGSGAGGAGGAAAANSGAGGGGGGNSWSSSSLGGNGGSGRLVIHYVK